MSPSACRFPLRLPRGSVVPVATSLCRLSQTTFKTVNGDFHKVKEDVFVKKKLVSKARGSTRKARTGKAISEASGAGKPLYSEQLLAEVGAQGSELGAQLRDFPLEAGEAVLGGSQLLMRSGRRRGFGIITGDLLIGLVSLL